MDEDRDLSQLKLERIASEADDYTSSPPEYKILTYPADFTVEVLVSKMRGKEKEIDIPTFQRGYVWKPQKACKLIESFLINLPVPPVFLYSESTNKSLMVIDGQQRLKTLMYFFDGYFPGVGRKRGEEFRLSTLHPKSKWFNKTYSELTQKQKRDLKNKVLRAFIVEQLNPKDNTSIYHIFERLNTGGMLLNNQEIRNSLFHGKLNDLMKDLNRNEEWRKIVGKVAPDKRQKDVELILRFLALHYKGKSYEKPMKDFMNDFMGVNRNPSVDLQTKIRKLFDQTCHDAFLSLGKNPFSRGAGLNTAIYDAVFLAFASRKGAIPADIKVRYKKLLRDTSFYKATRDATTDETVLSERLSMAKKLFV